jgi:hypothetical protein
VSSYRALGPTGEHAIEFCVGGEARSPLTAIASCVAKYARELHMALLNAYWCSRAPQLRPTAGYGRDAYRWLEDAAPALVGIVRDDLVRAGALETEEAGEPSPGEARSVAAEDR